MVEKNTKQISAYVISNIGNVRENHEDNFFIPKDNYIKEDLQRTINKSETFIENEYSGDVGVFAVCDGMGGHNSGEVASRMAVESIKDKQEDLLNAVVADEKNNLLDFIKVVNNEICDYGNKNVESSNMGSTFSALIIAKGKTYLLHVGDSRIYKIDNNELIQVSKDHTEGCRLVEAGIKKKEDLPKFPNRKLLYKYLGRKGELIADCSLLDNETITRYLIASDGLSDTLDDKEIMDEIKKSETAKDVCHNLLKKCLDKGDKCSDNVTIICIDI